MSGNADRTTRSHISVCICTYKRPDGLRRLLNALRDQATDDLFTYSVVLVDNDAAESGRAIANEAARPYLDYHVEPRQNIALARNRSVRQATGDFIAFIDDDEVPAADWLLTLFRCLKEYDADGVLGPVIPQFDPDRPQWVVDGGFYTRPRHPTGRRLVWSACRTGNALLKRQILIDNDPPFRTEFLSGEDQDFFKRMIERGCVFVWCDQAPVCEVVSHERWRRRTLIRRALFRGFFSLRVRGSSMASITQSLVAAPLYAAALPAALAFGQARFMSCAYKCSYHAGRLLAVGGFNPIRQAYVTDMASGPE